MKSLKCSTNELIIQVYDWLLLNPGWHNLWDILSNIIHGFGDLPVDLQWFEVKRLGDHIEDLIIIGRDNDREVFKDGALIVKQLYSRARLMVPRPGHKEDAAAVAEKKYKRGETLNKWIGTYNEDIERLEGQRLLIRGMIVLTEPIRFTKKFGTLLKDHLGSAQEEKAQS